MPPSIDAFSPKNQDLAPEQVEAILARAGIGPRRDGAEATFERADGSRAASTARPKSIRMRRCPPTRRWWRRCRAGTGSDPLGVVRGFAEHCRADEAHLLLAGPSVAAVSDDPEGAEVLAEVEALRDALPAPTRARVHLACLPMDDLQENAAMVNAIQRRAQVVVQKSLAEGFGLTVAEAMWKGRPVIASRAGGSRTRSSTGSPGCCSTIPATSSGSDALARSCSATPSGRR